MSTVRSGDADIFYEVLGSGPAIILLHPFPVRHEFWYPLAPFLTPRYTLVLPDLRGHGNSGVGEGPATMGKHAEDLCQVCAAVGVSKAVFAGVSISGYILMEFWRRHRQRVCALLLCNTRAPADSEESRRNRLKSIEQVRQNGPSGFLDSTVTNLLGATTRRNRPDIVQKAREMMNTMSVPGIAAAQAGMAERPDSRATLQTVDVPTLIIAGAEDSFAPLSESQLMKHNIANSRLEVIPESGHYSVLEQPELCGKIIRRFLDSLELSACQ